MKQFVKNLKREQPAKGALWWQHIQDQRMDINMHHFHKLLRLGP